MYSALIVGLLYHFRVLGADFANRANNQVWVVLVCRAESED